MPWLPMLTVAVARVATGWRRAYALRAIKRLADLPTTGGTEPASADNVEAAFRWAD